MDRKQFDEFRADGFPLCPQCKEDELYSHVVRDWAFTIDSKPAPAMEEIVAGGFTCYLCNWSCEGNQKE